jgi:hypothetical protein
VAAGSTATSAVGRKTIDINFEADDLVTRLRQELELTDEQEPKVDPIIREHESQVAAIRADASLTAREKRAKVRESFAAMALELKPLLTQKQGDRLDAFLATKPWYPTHFQVSASYESYFPSGETARSIFGRSPSALGFGAEVYAPTAHRGTKIGFSFDLFSLINGGNTEYVLAPQASLEHRIPLTSIAKHFWAYGRLAVGPAYFDYSFDTPDGTHYGAKRIGADGGAEIGLRCGPVELAANYRLLTAPAGVNLSGLQVSLTWFVFHF